MSALLLCFMLVATVANQAQAANPTPADFLITNLPGLNSPLNFSMYSGHITFNISHGRNMFFWFAESQRDPVNDPFIVWLNGGPGCSSLGGLFTELGPIFPNTDGKTLQVNPYSWNNVANVLFLESPSGVGFSYSDTKADYTTGDYQTAQDSVDFLTDFFKIFTQFAEHPLWISGESYGGHYVPNLALAIYESNQQGVRPFMNIEGFLVGNAWTDAAIDNQGAAFYWWTHAINTMETYEGIVQYCNFSNIGPLYSSFNADLCTQYCNLASTQMGNVNIYDIYNDVCLADQGNHLLKALSEADTPFKHLARNLHSVVNNITLDACIEDHMTEYLNIPAVQAAIHTKPIKWTQCGGVNGDVHYSREDLLTSMIPVYQKLFQSGMRKLVYSGDVDAIVPYTGTRQWVSSLNLTIIDPWRPWLDSTNQTGGYVTVYDDLFTFATVRQAGHMVPGTQPLRALNMLTRWLANEPL